jgi:replicative DNA helicase
MAEQKTRRKAQPNIDTLGLEIGNKPPQALEAEEAVLGAMLLEPAVVDASMAELTKDCFYDKKNQMIFEAMGKLVQEHTSLDIITVSEKLKALGNLEAVGGSVVLANYSERVGSAAHIEYYIKILKQKTIQRDLITASYAILKDAFDDSVDVDDLIDMAQTKVYDAVQNNVRKDVQEIGSVLNDVISDIQERQDSTGLSGVPSGFPTLDQITQGWQPSDLIILAARPSVGKTAFSLNIARNAAVDHHMPVAFFSLEMSATQLAKRLAISETGLSADKIKGAIRLEQYEWEQLEYKIKDLAKAPLYIDDTPGLPLMEFRTKAKNLVKNKGVRLIVVDYLQLMTLGTKTENRQMEVAMRTRSLKVIARELSVPIMVLSQLRRVGDSREGKPPQLSDLRESGSIEQDADVVIFLHRDDYFVQDDDGNDGTEKAPGKSRIIIAKQRTGPTGSIEVKWRGEITKYVEVDYIAEEE